LSATLDLVLGVGLTANKDKGNVFLYTGNTGTRVTAQAGVSGNHLDFTAQLGPFDLFVIDGSGNLSGNITLKFNDTGPGADHRLTIADDTGFHVSAITSAFDTTPDDILTGARNVDLQLFVRSKDSQIPIGSPNHLTVSVPSLYNLITDGPVVQ